MHQELSNEEIIATYELQDIINSNFYEDKFYGFDLDLDSFFLRCRNLKTQIYGLRVQAFLSARLKYKTTPSSFDCGDFKTRENEDVEFKCSFLDRNAKQINIKQIRQFQDIDWYYIFTVDYNDYRNLIYKLYKLNKKQMSEEMLIMNAQPIHSTKKQNEGNENIEYGFSIKINSEHFKRWEDCYLNKKFDLRKLNEEALEEIKTEKQIQSELENYKNEVIRLKIDHPEEIEKRNLEKEERIAEAMKRREEYLARKSKIALAFDKKRRIAFNKIPQQLIIDKLKDFNNGISTYQQLKSIIESEITKRFIVRKKKWEMKTNEQFSSELKLILNSYYKKITTYEIFYYEFSLWWNELEQRKFKKIIEKAKYSIEKVDNISFDKEEYIIEDTYDEYQEEKMRECRNTSVY